MSQITDPTLSFLRSDFAIEQAALVIFVSIAVIRIARGHFPPHTKWFALAAFLGVLQLWLRRNQRNSEPSPFNSIPIHTQSMEWIPRWRSFQLAFTPTRLYDFIAKQIKAQTGKNSCALNHSSEYNGRVIEGYAYYATTMGSNCDTFPGLETIENAVGKCANFLSKKQAVQGCCNLSLGRTWHTLLRLSSEPGMFPADQIDCPQ